MKINQVLPNLVFSFHLLPIELVIDIIGLCVVVVAMGIKLSQVVGAVGSLVVSAPTGRPGFDARTAKYPPAYGVRAREISGSESLVV
ncbi:hypothetical protein TNCV_2617001 [Trichonephila clavipes]|nr:hypothetical protein TNCV_2617001 [Trichonephila clavipes]